MFCGLAALGADARILEQRVTITRRQPDGTERVSEARQSVWLAGRMVRLEEQDGNVCILRFDRGLMYQLDVLMRSYEERDIRNLRARWKKINSLLLEQIEGAPADHPRRYELIDELTGGPDKWDLIWGLPEGPRKKELLEKYNLPPTKPHIKIAQEKEQKEIAGYQCRLYKVLEDGKLSAFAWVAPDVRIDKELLDFLRVAGLMPDEVAGELEKVKGFPLEYAVHWRDGRLEHTVTEKIENRKVQTTAAFEVPKDYQKTESRR